MSGHIVRIRAAEAEIAGSLMNALFWLLRKLPSLVEIQEVPSLPCVFSSPGVAIRKLVEGEISRRDVYTGFFMRWSPTWDELYWEGDLVWLKRKHPDATEFVARHFRSRRLNFKDYNRWAYRLISES